MKILLTADAEADFGDIGEYIARDHPGKAREFQRDLKAFILRIGQAPLSYRVRVEWSGQVRAARFGSYLVIFEVEDDHLLVLRIVNGRRNIPRLLSERLRCPSQRPSSPGVPSAPS